MAVLSVKESHEGVTLDQSASIDGVTGTMIRRFTVNFNTATDMKYRLIDAVYASAGGVSIPDYWDQLDPTSYGFWYVKDKRARQKHGPLLYEVDVIYEYVEDPLYAEPVVRWLPSISKEPIDKDKDGKPLLNSAGEPFEGIQEDYRDSVLQIVRNEATYNFDVAKTYINAINSTLWLPAAIQYDGTARWVKEYTAKCIRNDGEPMRVGPLEYYKRTYEFQIREDNVWYLSLPVGWRKRLLDQGLREKTGVVDGKPVYADITSVEGQPLTSPVKLDGSGKKLSDGAADHFLVYTTLKTIDFAGLSL